MYNKKEKEIIAYTRAKVMDLFKDYPVPAHGIDHVARVVGYTKLIASKEKADLFLSEMSAWLHDIGRTLEGHTNIISQHHELSYDLCRRWFKEDQILRDGLTRQQKVVVLYSVRYHWNNAADKYPVAWILRDADKIDTLGLKGIKRAQEFAGGDEKKQELDIRLRYDNFYWLHTKTARRFVEQKGLIKQIDRYYISHLRKKIEPIEL